MVRLFPAPCLVERTATAALHLRARDANEVEIVFRGRNSGPRDIFDHRADGIDLPVAIRAGKKDIGI